MTYYLYLLICLSVIPCMCTNEDEVPVIKTELCKEFCLENATCITYETPVSECYNAQFLFPDDPSWGPYDVKDDLLDNLNFARKIYSSTDRRCGDQTDYFELPFNECVGPFGPPRPWGTFELIKISNMLDTSLPNLAHQDNAITNL
jgi:hypothetical protein